MLEPGGGEVSHTNSYLERKAAVLREEEVAYAKLSPFGPEDLKEGCGFATPEAAKRAFDQHMTKALTNLDWIENTTLYPEESLLDADLKDEFKRLVESDGVQAVAAGVDAGVLPTSSMEKAVVAQTLSELARDYPDLVVFGGGPYGHLSFFVGDMKSALDETLVSPYSGNRPFHPTVALIKVKDLAERRGGTNPVRIGSAGRENAMEILISDPEELRDITVFRKPPKNPVAALNAFRTKAVTI